MEANMTSINPARWRRFFEEQAAQAPNKPAVVDINCNKTVSYRELNRQRRYTVGQLKDAGIRPGDIVALYLDSPLDSAAAAPAIWESGGVCLPIPTGYPPAYINSILRRSGATFLLASEGCSDEFEFAGKRLPVKRPDTVEDTCCAGPGVEEADAGETAGRPAFCIYSSHGAGRPEGIVLSHEKIIDWLNFNCEVLKIDFSRTLFISTPVMDTSFPLWLAVLQCGGTVYFYRPSPGDPLDISAAANLLREGNIRSIICPLFFLYRLVSQKLHLQLPLDGVVNIVTTGDETFAAGEWKSFIKEKKIKWHNYYGFPQMNMITTLVEDRVSGTGCGYRHMGRPGGGAGAFILTPAGRSVTVGITGDLLVSGSGVMSGFHRNDTLNSACFMEHTQAPGAPGENFYKTGYIAAWQQDGALVFPGRTDNRIMLKGFPMALEEIEALLYRRPLVEACAAVSRQSAGEPETAAVYVVLKENIPFGQLREYLEQDLPAEPLSAVGFIKLGLLPRLADGAVDRKFLQRIDYLDGRRLKELEQQLEKEPGILRAAVIGSEKIEKTLPLHIKNFLPKTAVRPAPAAGLDTKAAAESTGAAVEDNAPFALIEGGELEVEEGDPGTLVGALERAALQYGHHGIRYIHSDGSEFFQGYKELMVEAERLLGGLRHRGLTAGDKVIFQFNRDEDYTAAFWGCTLGGMVPVPIMVPKSFNEPTNETAMLFNVWEMLGHPVILTGESLQKSLVLLCGYYNLDRSKLITIESLRNHEPDHRRHRGSPGDLGILLFTSGSTGIPKGVLQPQRNILAREKAAIRYNHFDSSDISMNWMPLEHVGGVVMFHIRDIYRGCSQIQVRTDYILSAPLRWLDLIDKYKITITWAPNFAFGLVNEQIDRLKNSGSQLHWDLSAMKFILNGGEAINAATVKGFLTRLAPFGLRGDAMKPAWGMSETCSGVVYSHALTPGPDAGIHRLNKHSLANVVEKSDSEADAITFVELGRTIPGLSVRIADSNNRTMREGKVGRLQIKGSTVTPGYYNNPQLNREVFTADGWFDTGDQGFILYGKMTITGRAKDVIIINGINYNNIEIESIVDEAAGVETSFTAACAGRDPHGDTEKVIIFYASAFDSIEQKTAQIKKIEKKLVEKMGIKPDLVIPVAKEEIPKTSIGKIQRLKLAKSYETGYFDPIITEIDLATENDNTLPQWFFTRSWRPRPPAPEAEEMQGRVRLIFRDECGLTDALVKMLAEKRCTCIQVESGAAFEKVNAHRWKIDGRAPADYFRLLNEIDKEHRALDDIFFAWSYEKKPAVTPQAETDAETIDDNNIRRAQEKGVYGLLSLIQALDKVRRGKTETGSALHNINLSVITGRSQAVLENEVIYYENGGVPGFLKTAALELSWLNCRSIDLETEDPVADARYIFAEWAHPTGNIETAYRGGKRLVPLLENVFVGREPAMDLPIQKGGVYLATGGLGGIGALVSRWLISNYETKLILVGQTPLPPREQWDELLEEDTLLSKRISAFRGIAAAGGDFIYEAGDIADETFLQEIVNRARERWRQPLAGIFHLAGMGNLERHWQVMDQRWVVTGTRADFETMYRAKVFGTLRLHRLVEQDPTALFVAFSSTTAVFGSTTFSAYASANSFLDGFCQYRRSRGYLNTYCLNWSAWDNVGMSENNAAPMVNAMLENGFRSISPQRGLYSLALALQAGYPQSIIGLDNTHRDIRKNMLQYPSNRQVLDIYYSVSSEANYSEPGFRGRAADILASNNRVKENSLPPIPVFHLLETMPLIEGEIDYRQLEVMGKKGRVLTGGFDMPATPTEKILVHIWQELLGKTRVGVADNFFELGGHSLKGAVMIARVEKELEVDITLGDIFKTPTIRGLAQYIDSSCHSKYQAILPREKKDYYPLSPAQRRLYIINRMVPGSTGYNLPHARLAEGVLDRGKLEQAFRELIRRHESFRTYFLMYSGEAVQRVADSVEFDIAYHDLSGPGGERPWETEEKLKKLFHSFERPFDLSCPPLVRAQLIKLEFHKHLLLVDIHHIIADGLSLNIFIDELKALYLGMELPGLTVQYKDYSAWQNRRLHEEGMKQQKTYWLNQFADEIPVLDLPLDFPRPQLQDFAGKALIFTVGPEETRMLKQLAMDEDATLYMVMLAAYYVLLSKLGNREDIILGTSTAGRRHADLEPLIGMFVNTLAIRNFPTGGKSFKKLLEEVKTRSLEAFENQDYPFEDLVEQLELNRDMSRNPLFEVMFVFENLDVVSSQAAQVEIPNLCFSPYPFEVEIAMFDLTIALEEMDAGQRLKLYVEFCTRLFKPETIGRFVSYYNRILSSILENPLQKLWEIEIISPEEKKKILLDFNNTGVEYPRDKTIPQLFEEQVERLPDRIAVFSHGRTRTNTDNNVSLGYRLLNEQSGRLAGLLIKKGVLADDIVGIMMERSIDLIIGIIGILKAGAAYLPIDPGSPEERIDYMLKESAAKLLVAANNKEGEKARRWDGEKVLLEFIIHHSNQLFSHHSSFIIHHSNHLAYIIYTSGSTGIPKGVPITYANLCPLLHWGYDSMNWGSGDHVIQTMAYYFDWSAWEIFLSLTSGASLYMIPEEILLNAGFQLDFIKRHDITVMETTPTRFQSLIAGDPEAGALSTLRCLCIGAEKLTVSLVKQVKKLIANDCRVFNLYGPTEATIISSALEIDMAALEKYEYLSSIPIGSMVGNGSLLVLDKYLNVCPVNVMGELYIAGDGVGLGYLNNPELTAEKFGPQITLITQINKIKDKDINKSFAGVKGGLFQKPPLVAYKTGDLARWLANGNIEFLGRIDQQVKIRGFRIELGEIEKRLRGHETIKDAIVIERKDKTGDNYLCAYIVFKDYIDEPELEKASDITRLRDYLAGKLPGYMIPAHFFPLKSIPLTPSGKMDRKALPATEPGTGVAYTSPRDEAEERLTEIWSEVLSIPKDKISIDDSFFHVGGHSLKLIMLAARIHMVFDVIVPISKFFEISTVRALAQYMKTAAQDKYTDIEPVEKRDYYPMSSAQKRLYVMQAATPGSINYNMPLFTILEGFLGKIKLENIFRELIRRHESLRTSFHLVNSNPVQKIRGDVEFEVGYKKLSTDYKDYTDEKNNILHFIHPFDLSHAPMVRVGLIKTKEKEHILMVDMHHIISDGISHQVLLKEFLKLFKGDTLPGLRLQYKDFSQWQNNMVLSGRIKKQEEYWLNAFKGDLPVLKMPTDYPRPVSRDFKGSDINFDIDSADAEALRNLAVKEDATLFMVMLTICAVFLFKLSGQEDIIVGTAVAGRRHADLENIIGVFINTLALRNYPSGSKRFIDFLREVKQQMLEAFDNQDYQFEDLVGQVLKERDTRRNPLFDIMFGFGSQEKNPAPEQEEENPAVEIKLKPYNTEYNDSKFDLLISGTAKGDRISFSMQYSTQLFKTETILRFSQYFKEIIAAVVENENMVLKDIPLSTDLASAEIRLFQNDGSDFGF